MKIFILALFYFSFIHSTIHSIGKINYNKEIEEDFQDANENAFDLEKQPDDLDSPATSFSFDDLESKHSATLNDQNEINDLVELFDDSNVEFKEEKNPKLKTLKLLKSSLLSNPKSFMEKLKEKLSNFLAYVQMTKEFINRKYKDFSVLPDFNEESEIEISHLLEGNLKIFRDLTLILVEDLRYLLTKVTNDLSKFEQKGKFSKTFAMNRAFVYSKKWKQKELDKTIKYWKQTLDFLINP